MLRATKKVFIYWRSTKLIRRPFCTKMKSYSQGYWIKNEQIRMLIVGYVSKKALTPIGIPFFWETSWVPFMEMSPGFTKTTHKKDLTKNA